MSNAELGQELLDHGLIAWTIETLLTDPEAEPDQAKWEIQVAFKIYGN